MLDSKAVKALPDDELIRWYRIVEQLTRGNDVMKEVQSQIKGDLQRELNERGMYAISISDSREFHEEHSN